MIRKRTVIAGVSDVSLGYGSPQIPAFVGSLRELYQAEEAYVFEPDQPGRPARHARFPDLHVVRVPTAADPYSGAGWIEYNWRVGQHLRELDPDVLIVFSPPVVPALWQVRGRPKVSIYYMLEGLAFYLQGGGHNALLRELHAHLRPYIDLVVYPEENRAALDASRGNLLGLPMTVLYNAAPSGGADIVPPRQRLPRLLYSGAIQRQNTLADYFFDDAVRSLPIDLYGPVGGEGAESLAAELAELTGGTRYHGLIEAARLADLRRSYSFALVLWAPINDNQLYACPNKFFEAIADGVPPITGPHPQCKALIERYECGLLMDDWSLPAFRRTLGRARSMMGTPEHARMIANCQRAAREELNWETQFDKVRRLLPAQL